VLWVCALFNVVGALLFTFPASSPSQLGGLPASAPPLYRGLTGLFIFLFGCAYAWLAAQPAINRPFVAFGAIGKAAAFAVVMVLWLAGETTATSVALMSGDLVLAGLLAYGLGRG
jgi:hypothetical protein